MGGCTQVICKYCAILYKGHENPQILVSTGGLEQIPHDHQGAIILEIERT